MDEYGDFVLILPFGELPPPALSRSRAAAALSLGYEEVIGPVNLTPDAEIQQCQIIGEATAVATNAKVFKQEAEKKAQEQWVSYNSRLEIARAHPKTSATSSIS